MGMYYAEIDASGICFHLTAQELPLSDTILRTERSDVLGMRYEGGEWHEVDEGLSATSQLDNIERVQLTMMEAMADQYEESQDRELTNMDVLATVYEEILSIKGEA